MPRTPARWHCWDENKRWREGCYEAKHATDMRKSK